MSARKLRLLISETHPVFGDGYRKLGEDEILEAEDQTACVSCLLSMSGDKWTPIESVYEDMSVYGFTVQQACDETNDIDGNERVFRRAKAKGAA